MHLKLRTLALVLLSAALLTSCASERVKEQARREKANKDQYVDYYPVGSNIPIKIPKEDAKPSEDEVDKTEAAFRDIQRATQQAQSQNTATQTGIPGAQNAGGPGPR